MAVLPDLTERELTPELMDDPDLGADDHARALRGLARLNRAAGSTRILWSALRDAARDAGSQALRVLDIATGSGDLPVALQRCASRAGLTIHIDGCDVSPRAIQAAESRAARAGFEQRCAFFKLDALTDELPQEYDIIMSSLFIHHLNDEQVVDLLYRMRSAAVRGILVSDLERKRLGFVLAWSASRILTRSEVVHTDALRSVRAAYTMDEVMELAIAAGLRDVQPSHRWPCRFLLKWSRS